MVEACSPNVSYKLIVLTNNWVTPAASVLENCFVVYYIMTAHEIEERAVCVVCRISDREAY